MMLASYYGGVCLGLVNTAGGHALAYPLGTRVKLPHGLANAIIFPHMLAFNAPAAREKTAQICDLLQFSARDQAGDILAESLALSQQLAIKTRLSAHGAASADLHGRATEAHAIRRLMDNNPKPILVEDALSIYQAAMP